MALVAKASAGDVRSYNYLTLNYLNEKNNSESNIIIPKETKSKLNSVEIICPDDISTYTDLNSCTSYISDVLNVQYPENSITLLTWEMTGATVDNSESTGINQINEYEFNEGITIITYTAENQSGNITSCSFTVTIADNQVPRLEAIPGDITVQAASGECSAPVSWRQPAASDNCTSSSEIFIEASISSGSIFPIGENTVYYHAYDAMGNKSARQSFTVTVEDSEYPQLELPDEITINCEDEVPAPWQTLQQLLNSGGFATDNCDIDETSFQLLSETADDNSCPFTITRTYEISDIHGNKTSAKYLIHVVAPEQVTPVLKSGAETTATVTTTTSNVTCNNGNDGAADLTITDVVGTLTITWSASNGGSGYVQGNEDQSTLTAGDYTVIIDDSGAGKDTINFSISEPPVLNATVSSTNITCNGANDGAITVSSPTGGYGTYEYRLNAGTWQSNGTFSNLAPNTYSVEIRDAANTLCTEILGSETLTEPPVPTVNSISDQLLCPGDATTAVAFSGTGTSYNWINDNTSIGLAASGTGTIPSFTATNSSSTQQVAIIIVTPIYTNNGVDCTGTPETFTFTVEPDNTISLSSASGTDNQSVCINEPVTVINFASTGATGATFSGLPTGVNGSWTLNTVTVSGTPTVSGTFNYTITLTGGCGNVTESGTITVNPTPTTTVPADQTYCINETTAPISLSGTPSNVVYDISGGNAIGLADQTDVIQIPSFTTTSYGTASISITPKANGCSGIPQTFTITVEDVTPPVINSCPSDINLGVTAGRCDATVSWTPPTATDNCTSSANLNWTNNHSPGGVFPVGTTTVTYTVNDEAGLQSNCSFDVTITDDEDPVINCPSNISAFTDAGSCNATVSVIATANDNCPGLIVTNDVNSGGADASGTYDIGTTTVTFTATDAAGNTSVCSVDVTVQDNQDPVITCPGSITQEADAGTCEATISNLVASFTDNCAGGTITNNYNTNGNDASDTYPIGTTTVTFTATDAAGNQATCQTVVIVTDNEAPAVTCPSDITQTADAGKCEAYVNVPAASLGDNCSGGTITNNYNSGGADASGTYPVGTTIVEYTATDAAGNTSTCSVNITITDNEAPVPDIAILSDVYGDVCETTTVNPPTAKDNCAGDINATTSDVTSFDAVGDYIIHWEYDDGNGNTVSQDQLVHISSNGPPSPTVDNLPVISGQCSAEITAQPTATSNCGTDIPGLTGDPLVYSSQGTYTVTWTYYDFVGMMTTTQTQTVIVKDTESPVFDSCPTDRTVDADAGTCGATISGLTASATDNCSTATITNDYNSNGEDASDVYPVGTTTVTFTATDEAGNTSTCVVNITVNDNEAPAFTNCPSTAIPLSADPGDCEASVTLPVINATDNCSNVTITNDFNSGGADASGIYPLGTTTVIYTATDETGNNTTCSVDIVITDDEPPVINCPANIIQTTDPGTCEAYVTVPVPTYIENCSNATITNDYNSSADASDTYPLGTTTVSFTATDDAGNISTTCSVTITVVDEASPVKPTLDPIFETCEVTLANHPAPTTTDDCDGVITGTTSTSFPITSQGITTVLWTFTDSEGNSVTANQQLSIDDNTSPVWDNPSFFTSIVNLQCGDDTSPANTGLPTATDNCTPVTVNYIDNVIPGSCPGASTIERTWTAEDENGNVNTKTQTIYVTDNTKPVVICRDTTVANPDEIFDPYVLEGISFSDNCGIDTVFLVDEQLVFTENGQAGFCPEEVIREYVVYDQCGNVSNTCTQVITVSSPGSCAVCQEDVPYRLANLDGAPDSTWVLNEKDLTREGACCQGVDGNTAWGCMSFNVYLDEDAVGLIFTVEKPAPSGVEYYRINCGPMTPLGEEICLAGGEFYTLTFCKPGEDKPIYTIQSISGAITSDSLTTRADVDCFGDLHVAGLEPATINWSVKYPSGADSLLSYLDMTDIENPVFTPDSITPALIIYEVCGTLLGSPECDGNPIVDCADVIVNVLPPVKINLDVDVTAICENEIPPIHAEIPNMDPNLTYTFNWYNGPDGTGSVVSTDPDYQPTDIGTYSVLVTEITSGVGCNRDITNFNIAYDMDGPSVLAPPDTLFIDCSATDFDQQVLAWLAIAEAHETEDPTINVQVNNDYTYISPSCGLAQVVHFTATDNCGNISQDSAVIYVEDEIAPVINTEASDVVMDCATINPDEDPNYLAWLSTYGGASATDDCDTDLTWSADTATAVWVGNGARDSITVTFTVTDDCENTDATTATFTVIDDQPPTISCPDDVEEIIAQELCSSTISVDSVFANDLCSEPNLSWEMTGATTGTGTGQVTEELFNVGQTIVVYTATDDAGLTATCSFQVWVKHASFPTDAITCPDDSVWAQADPINCNANVILGTVTINDPCNEIDLIWNDSPYAASSTDASGNYPIGVTDFSWYITDVSGNEDTCNVTVIVEDVDAPQFLTCPADTLEDIVDAADCDMTNFNLVDPTWDVGCGASLRYELSGATTGSGTDLIDPAVVHFNVGVTTVTYILEDPSGNADTCIFWAWAKHAEFPSATITCPTDTVRAYADPVSCDAAVTLGTVTFTDPCNEIDSIWNDSPYAASWSDASGSYPIGTTDFAWYILDVSGNTETCDVTVIVEDVDAPQFLTCPADTLEDIVDAADCDMTNFNLVDPTWDVGCGASLRYELSGATTGSGTDLIDPAVVHFNVGVTTVTYILEDPSGNADTCMFWAWAKHTEFPSATVTCPADTVRAIADPVSCDAAVTLGTVTFTDPCNEIDSIWNDSPYAASWSDASGSYPIGTTDFAWYILDVSGNTETCDVTVIVEDVDAPQFLSCPSDTLEDIISAADCDMSNFNLVDPSWDVGCGASLRYELSGATTGSGTDLIDPAIVHFNVGVTTVTYILEDPSGNADTCIFWAWAKRAEFPSATYNCPQPLWNVDADTDSCNATLALDKLEILSDPCNEIDSIWNDSPATGATASDASGTYDIGSTTFNWYIRDVSDNVDTCEVTVIVNDLLPSLVCPPDTTVQADFEVPYKDNVTIELPTYYDNCPDSVLTYTIEEPDGNVITSATTGINLVPNPRRYQLGVTTITYTFTDAHGHALTCDFTVTVLGEPEIECPPIDTLYADANCIYPIDPGIPTLLEGIPPIEWTWTLTEPDGTVYSGNSIGNAPDPSPLPIGIHDFPLGTTTVEWIAENISGADTCSHTITVIDTIAPVIASGGPFEFCVDPLNSAVFNASTNLIYDPDYPIADYYTFTAGSTDLDIDISAIVDNCCDAATEPYALRWEIDFDGDDPSEPTISGTGQPSEYSADIHLWGDGTNYQNRIHKISYWVTDCYGNESEPYVVDLTITPRPEIVKQN